MSTVTLAAPTAVSDAPPVGTPDTEIGIEAVVARKQRAADGVVSVVLAAPDGGELPPWAPGAHIDVMLGDLRVRQYSLSGDPADRLTWRLGVLHEPGGSGTSHFIHDELQEGDRVVVRGPRNAFPLEPSDRYLFIGGGIGITPLLPMVAQAEAAGADWRLVYGGRQRSSMAFLDELAAYGDRVVVHPQDECGLIDLAGLLGAADDATLVYCCGPEPLLAAVEEHCGTWPVGALHLERFAAKPVAAPVLATSFEVVLQESGLTLTVPPERSILQVVEQAGVSVLTSCGEGTCGTCETTVLEGEPDHRDSVLSDVEKAANDCMMICVSRSCGSRLVLEL